MRLSKSRSGLQFFVQLLLSLLLVLFGTNATKAQDQTPQTPDLQQMQKKLEQLEKEMAELKQQMATAEQLTKTAVPGPSIPVKTETRDDVEQGEQTSPSNSVEIYGFVQLDSGYNFGAINPDWFDVVRAPNCQHIPVSTVPTAAPLRALGKPALESSRQPIRTSAS